MPANLATTNGKPALMYAGEVPWHQLGTKLNKPATAQDAITAAGLDFDVQLEELVTRDGKQVLQRKAVVRTHTMALLPGSPAIDAGDNTDAPEFDQRGLGFPRIVNDTIDIGAFEVQATGAPIMTNLAVLITADLDSKFEATR